MNLSSIAGPGGIGAEPATQSNSVSVQKEAFLKLLVAQMSNQDPLAPQDSEKYVEQLTQFSSLEQMMNLNDGVNNLALGQMSNNSQEAVRFVGREVVARGDELSLEADGEVPIRYQVDPEADTVTISIYGSDGKLVRQSQVPADRGGGVYEWDGRDEQGRPMPAGRYQLSIEAADAGGNPLSADTFLRGQVTGVRFDNGYPELLIGDRRLRMSDIIEVN